MLKVLFGTILLLAYGITSEDTVTSEIPVPANASSPYGRRPKSELTPEEQKKLVDTLNADRQEVGKRLGIQMNNLTYNVTLEEMTAAVQCRTSHEGPMYSILKFNRIAQNQTDHGPMKKVDEMHLFWPFSDGIGCSKLAKCAFRLLEKDHSDDLIGQTAEYYGACKFDTYHSDDHQNIWKQLRNTPLPSPSKYGDIIGVKTDN